MKINEMESKYINPSQSQCFLRDIYDAEEDLIKYMVPILNDVKGPHPTDVFFFKVNHFGKFKPYCWDSINFSRLFLFRHQMCDH